MSPKFVFRSNQNIGAAAAEQDILYLSECFIETGDLDILRDAGDSRCLLLGRTGAGKSALLAKLQECEERVIVLEPEALSLTYIANSNILKFFSELDVKLDIFYRLLWRHIMCIELLRERFGPRGQDKGNRLVDWLSTIIPKKPRHKLALEYLSRYDSSFWQETDKRIREMTQGVETELQGAVQAAIAGVEVSSSGARRLTSEQKAEVVQRGRDVVNRVQIRELNDVIDLLGAELITDPQKKYFIVIDSLDTDWVEDSVRLRLIRALMETSVHLTSKIQPVKVIVAIRRDLTDRVFRYTREPGFQEEKYDSCSLEIRWSRKNLTELLDRRIQTLVRHQYTKQTVTHVNLLPNRIGKQKTIDYILDRTLERPRDVIQFFNECIVQADGKPTISLTALRAAEGVYSRKRLRSLLDEWISIHPHLAQMAQLLKKRRDSFAAEEITDDELEELILGISMTRDQTDPQERDYINEVLQSENWEMCRAWLVRIFYRVGLVGLKTDSYQKISWSYQGDGISEAEISAATRLFVHRMFWRVLGINESEGEDAA